MDNKLKTLLLKTRKGATEGFTMKDAVAVLEACGCKVVAIKDKNSIESVVVEAPNGVTERFDKDPQCRRLGGHELLRARIYRNPGVFENPVRPFAIKKACELLEMPTIEEEQADKKTYGARVDVTNTGTCPCCFGLFKREPNGEMVHHGYRRPGTGETIGNCIGEEFDPLEVSVEGSKAALQGLESLLAMLKYKHKALKAGGPVVVKTRNRFGGYDEKLCESGDPLYGQHQHAELCRLDFSIGSTQRCVRGFKALVAGWVPDELPEIRYPKKQPLKLQPLIEKCY